MLQIIDREFKNLKDLIKYSNKISIEYDYLRDYKIIEEKDKYILLLQFDVPEVMESLKLARLNVSTSKDFSTYKIELDDKSRKKISNISIREVSNGLEIMCDLGTGNVWNIVEINYAWVKEYFSIELRNFKFNRRDIEEDYPGIDNILWVKDIDHNVIYNHIIKFLLNRGYLIDRFSLTEIEHNLYYVAKWLNNREFE